MKQIEHSLSRLTLRSSPSQLTIASLFSALLVGFLFLPVIFILQQSQHIETIVMGMGSLIIIVIFFAMNLLKVNTFTFDKTKNCILWEQSSSLAKSAIKSVQFPMHIVAGVEVTISMGEGVSYYPRLILASVYWRIPLDSNGSYESAAILAQKIAQFLNVEYFPDESKAPLPIWQQKTLESSQNWQPHWKYLENEVERLQHCLEQDPQDTEALQNLGISLYLSNRLHRKQAVGYLQQAEKLFKAQQEEDCAAITKVIQALIHWGY
jgi:hypothetical protein